MNAAHRKPIAVLLNPSAGRGWAQRKRRALEGALQAESVSYELLVSESEEHFRRLVVQAASIYPALAIAGGDSSLFIAVNEVLNHRLDVPLGILGVGSCNDLARGLDIAGLRRSCRAIKRMAPRPIDIGLCSCAGERVTYFPGQASLGLGVDVNRRIAELQRSSPFFARHQTWAGIKAASGALKSPPLQLTVDADGRLQSGAYILALFSNVAYYASGMKVLPRARPDDGLLDALLLPPLRLGRLLGLGIKAWLGRPPATPRIVTLQAPLFTVKSETPFQVQADGEIIRQDGAPRRFHEISLQTVPAAIRLLA